MQGFANKQLNANVINTTSKIMKEDSKLKQHIVIKDNEIRGEKLIFDLLIKEKLAHVIVVRANQNYHINLDGEDLGYFTKNDQQITHFPQPKGAHKDLDAYFEPIEQHLETLEREGVKWTAQSEIDPQNNQNDVFTGPKDGLDNTGTQGYDSLTDDGFTGSSQKPNQHKGEYQSRTGSANTDFHDAKDDF